MTVFSVPSPDAPDVRLCFERRPYDPHFPTCHLIDPLTGHRLAEAARPVHHSPCGIAWGYEGSGPSDLALYIMSLHFPLAPDAPKTDNDLWKSLGYPMDTEQEEAESFERLDKLPDVKRAALDELFISTFLQRPVQVTSGHYVSRQAWDLYQRFKFDVLAPLPQDEEATITAQSVRDWYEAQARHTLN